LSPENRRIRHHVEYLASASIVKRVLNTILRCNIQQSLARTSSSEAA